MERNIMDDLIKKVEHTLYHEFVGMRVSSCDEGMCEVKFPATENTLNICGAIHGGMYHTVCDVAAFLAVCTLVPDDVLAVTSDFNTSIMSVINFGEVTVRARVLKMGKRLCFVESKAFDVNDTLIAVARVTKTLVPYPGMEALVK